MAVERSNKYSLDCKEDLRTAQKVLDTLRVGYTLNALLGLFTSELMKDSQVAKSYYPKPHGFGIAERPTATTLA